MKSKNLYRLVFVWLICLCLAPSAFAQDIRLHSDRGVTFLYRIDQNGGYRVKLIVRNDRERAIQTSNNFTVWFADGSRREMYPVTVNAHSFREYTSPNPYAAYPNRKTWKAPSWRDI